MVVVYAYSTVWKWRKVLAYVCHRCTRIQITTTVYEELKDERRDERQMSKDEETTYEESKDEETKCQKMKT